MKTYQLMHWHEIKCVNIADPIKLHINDRPSWTTYDTKKEAKAALKQMCEAANVEGKKTSWTSDKETLKIEERPTFHDVWSIISF